MSSVEAHLRAKSVSSHVNIPKTELKKASIRFAGDSGDGMQLTGTRFPSTSARRETTLLLFLIIRLRFVLLQEHWQVYQVLNSVFPAMKSIPQQIF